MLKEVGGEGICIQHESPISCALPIINSRAVSSHDSKFPSLHPSHPPSPPPARLIRHQQCHPPVSCCSRPCCMGPSYPSCTSITPATASCRNLWAATGVFYCLV